ncbi:preprotein translocase subunit SecA [Candidatus Parcubacteria bacterium]|nr:preprotein translocase subunit SecA [Candidatus Parcubacteria bacterium]
MGNFSSIFSKFFSGGEDKHLKKIQPLVEEINSLESKFEGFSDGELKGKATEFKERIVNGESLDILLSEAFAVVREAAKRTLQQRHYDVQLIGGIILHQGRIAEMKTGEGKTLSSTLAVYLNALEQKGVHVITVNDYLTKRDMVWMGQVYHLLGLSIGCIVHDAAYIYDPTLDKENDEARDLTGGFKVIESYLKPVSRKEAYQADVTYGTNNEFGFDYLRDNMVYDAEARTQREFNYAVVDEIDSILIDEARTPLIISAPDTEATKTYGEFAKIIPHLKEDADYSIDEKLKAVTLTEEGVEKVEKILGMENIYEEKGIKYLHHLEQALRAQALFKKDKDYTVREGQIIIVDEFTGRLLPGRRYSGGLHQAIEAKEGAKVQPESMTLASITFQNYFRMYKKLAGMTGTALTSAEEFDKVYGLEVTAIPTNKPMLREDLSDRVYKTRDGKFKAVVAAIKERHEKDQPILVGTVSIERNEYLGKLLEREGIPHKILNAKRHEQEGEIIAQAGKKGAVTIATNMAGRGVDITLGGNPAQDMEEIAKIGGLHIIGTERHEARRIDNQLRGRAGRQGDPGSSQFFISLEDDLLRIFGGDKIKSLMEMLKIPEDEPIEVKLISGAIESAQSKIEGMNFDLRKHLLDYDDVLNKHREVVYKKRAEVLEKFEQGRLKAYVMELAEKQGQNKEDYEKKEAEIGTENMRRIEKIVCLRTLDFFWMDHLEAMDHLRDSVRLRAYGQQDPLIEYKNEGHRMFRNFLDTVESAIVKNIFAANLPSQPSVPMFSEPSTSASSKTPLDKKAGRNDPCPCGSGKKYKKCCYPKYG